MQVKMLETMEINGREFLTHVLSLIKQDEWETRERIELMSGMDGDADLVSKREWRLHRERCATLERQADAVLKHLAVIEAAKPICLRVRPANVGRKA